MDKDVNAKATKGDSEMSKEELIEESVPVFPPKMITVEDAAKERLYSLRHFRRVLEEYHVPIKDFGVRNKKFFILRMDMERVPINPNPIRRKRRE